MINSITNRNGSLPEINIPHAAASLNKETVNIPCLTGTISHIIRLPEETSGEGFSMLRSLPTKFDRYTREQRLAGANILNAHLLMVEIMMSSITNKYVHSVLATLKECGLMRHNIKRRANALNEVSTDLMKRCNLHDKAQVHTFTKNIFPSLSEQYYTDGGSLILRLQNNFFKQYSNQITLIKVATKNAIDKVGIKESDLVTDIQMVAMMCQTGIEFYDTICRKVDGMLAGLGNIERKKSQHNEKMLLSVKELLREMTGNIAIPEQEGKNVRTLTFQFQRELVNENLLQMIESGITAMQMDFIEYVLAALRTKIESRTITIADYRMLFLRMGSKKNVRALINEIAAIPLPEGDMYDLFDVMETLPESRGENEQGGAESCIDRFRRLSLADRIVVDVEKEEDIELRKLRQEVYRNNGVLPMLTLRYLYHRLGTKKAVSEYLAKAGEEVMHKTLRLLKSVKADELKLSSGKAYGLFIGQAIRKIYEQKGYTQKEFAKKAGVPVSDMNQLETMGDVSQNKGIELAIVRLIADVAKMLKVDARLILFASLQETGKEGGLPQAYFNMMAQLGNKHKESKSEEYGTKI